MDTADGGGPAPAGLKDLSGQLSTMLNAMSPQEPDLDRIIVVLANIGHLLTYLEGNQRHLGHEQLISECARLLDDPGLHQRLRDLMSRRPGGEGAHDVLETWCAYLERRSFDRDAAHDAQEQQTCDAMEKVLADVDREQVALLTRLGARPGLVSPGAVFFQTMAHLNSPASRAKLAFAWDQQRSRRRDELVGLVDRLIQQRWEYARDHGHDSPLDWTLQRSTLTEEGARTFVADYVTQAIGGHDLLRDEIRTATDSPDDPMNHFAHYVRQITAGSALPLIPVRACVDLGRAVIEDVFGLEVTSLDPAATTVIRLSLTRHGKATGAIHVEMKSAGPAPSLPVARPLSSGGIAAGPELPVGRCLARYQLDEHGVQVMNLEAAHSLLHEFGHAVNHVLLAERRPGVTGLDYLPVERLEDLSAWFEKWAFHDELLRYTDFSAEQTRGLLVSRQVKMLEFLSTHLRRAVVGALDLQVHSEPVGIQEAFQRLIGQHDIEGYCALGDVLEYFVRPLFRAHPGCAGLTYLWSYAFGAERFEPFCAVTLQTAGARLSDDLLRSCFVPSEVSVRPDVSAVRRFYEGHVPLALIIRA